MACNIEIMDILAFVGRLCACKGCKEAVLGQGGGNSLSVGRRSLPLGVQASYSLGYKPHRGIRHLYPNAANLR